MEWKEIRVAGVFVFFLFVWYSESGNDSTLAKCIRSNLVHQRCDLSNSWPVPDCDDHTVYFDCIRTANNQSIAIRLHDFQKNDKKIDDILFEKSISRVQRRSKRLNSQIGSNCFYNTDCLSGMYCNAGRCICMSTYVQKDNFCYEKINPGQSGCIYNEQCSGVWARTTCVNGICACPTVAAVVAPLQPIQTKDGVVCGADSYCPLPIDDGLITVLDHNTAVCTSVTDCGRAPTMRTPGSETINELYECSALTSCCPNRAYTCSLPMGALPSSGAGFWYNAATGQCQQIVAGAPNINSNNFATLDHCQSYCALACPRGNPQYANGKPLACSVSQSCGANFDCTPVGSVQWCCPRANFVCSQNGGISNVPPSQINEFNAGFVPAAVVPPPPSTTRYYYDSRTRQCTSFAYLSAGGNFNNFLTLADCQNYCMQKVLCSKGSPLLDASGNAQRCSSAIACPLTHTCVNSVCCPSKQTICAQSQQQGTCSQYSQRFWYNQLTKQCEQFSFSGCQGNDNNFMTTLECQNFCKATNPEPQCIQGKAFRDSSSNFVTCSSSSGVPSDCPNNYECHFDGSIFGCCPTKAYTCSLRPNAGASCGPNTVRWSFDSKTQTCSSITYLGCDGNSNNFPSKEQCENYCGATACPNGGQPLTESTGNRIRLCAATSPCPTTHECVSFASVSSVPISYCCPTKTFICGQIPDAGQVCNGASADYTRYYYDANAKSCQTLIYKGCGGNGNNFQTFQQCMDFCDSAVCSDGETVYANLRTRTVATCNATGNLTCPRGYTCQSDPIRQRSVCCGSTDMGVCQNGERAYLESRTGEPKLCVPNSIANSCPSPYFCRLGSEKNKYYCCAPLISDYCPGNYLPFLTSGTNKPIICTSISREKACPIGYSCRPRATEDGQGYCCTENSLCPLGYSILKTPDGPESCTIGKFSACPANYECSPTSLNSASGYCCKKEVETKEITGLVCNTGNPLLINNNPTTCDPMLDNPCPPGYQCQIYAKGTSYYCCSVDNIITVETVCPSGAVYTVNGVPKICDDSLVSMKPCPPGYICTNGAGKLSYCCIAPSSEVCGTDSHALETGGFPISCNPFRNLCPLGYACQYYEPASAHFCCETALTSCPNGGSVTNRTCNPAFSERCPIGQSCQYIEIHRRYECCDVGLCSDYRSAYIDDATGAIKLCGIIAMEKSCPFGHSCQLSTKNVAICCPIPIQAPTCFNGGRLYVSPENQYQACDSGVCPFGTVCSVISNGKHYCCYNNLGIQCPGNRRPFLNPVTGAVRFCQLESIINSCPNEFSCQLSRNGENYICCSIAPRNVTRSFGNCPNGVRPFLYPPTQTPVVCTPKDDRCPGGFLCTKVDDKQYYCCGVNKEATPTVASGCPQGMKAMPTRTSKMWQRETENEIEDGDAGQVQRCFPTAPFLCPQPYQCVYSAFYSRYQCCVGWLDLTKWLWLNEKKEKPCPENYVNVGGDCLLESRFLSRRPSDPNLQRP